MLSTPLAAVYHTLPGKSRLDVLNTLRNQRPRTYLLNDEAEASLARLQLPAGVRRNLAHLPRNQVLDEATFSGLLQVHLPNAGPHQQPWIREALTMAAYHA